MISSIIEVISSLTVLLILIRYQVCSISSIYEVLNITLVACNVNL